MSKKFTGVHSGGQNIPVYDKDAHSAIEQKLDTSAFQSVSGNFLTAVPDAYATKEYADDVASSAANAAASGKLDTDTFSQVSGDFLTAVPQSYLQNTDLTVTSGKVTEISGIPLSAGGGTLPDTIPVSGVSGISVTETENEVLIGISADFATPADLENKLDTSAFSSVSGNFLTAVPENYSTKEYLSEQISGKYDTSSFAEVSGNFLTAVPESAISGFATHDEVESATSGLQEKGDYYSASNPSGFITGVDLTPYQTIEGMSAYQEKGDYYSASNPSGFISTVPDTYLQNTDLTVVDNKITEISGIALSAGDELPAGTMNTSGLEYNAVNEISGYNGSAIAQYGAEKQWLQHDDTLVHAANSAQYALGVNLSAVAQLLGVDETVLYSAGNQQITTYQLSELPSNFKEIGIYWKGNAIDGGNHLTRYDRIDTNLLADTYVFPGSFWSTGDTFYNCIAFVSGMRTTNWNRWKCGFGALGATAYDYSRDWWMYITKIVGIGRKQ